MNYDGKHVIYRRLVGNSRNDQADTREVYVYATREASGFAVWLTWQIENEGLVLFTFSREAAIEFAVSLAQKMLQDAKGKKLLFDDWKDTEEAAQKKLEEKYAYY